MSYVVFLQPNLVLACDTKYHIPHTTYDLPHENTLSTFNIFCFTFLRCVVPWILSKFW
jgi:hypothetical protein